MAWAEAVERLNDSVRRTFGETLTYTPAAGAPFALTAVRSNGIPTEGQSPGNHVVLGVKLADFAVVPAAGDAFTIGAKNYRVHDVQDDSGGWAQITGERIDLLPVLPPATGSGLIYIPLQVLPTSSGAGLVVPVSIAVDRIVLSNPTGVDSEVFVQDNQVVPMIFHDGTPLARQSPFSQKLGGTKFTGGLRWWASITGVTGMIVGRAV